MDRPRSRLPSLKALASFEALLRRGSIKAAADELAVTPQAVSQQVKMLEEQLNTSLISFERRRWRLTAAGEAGADILRAAFDGLHRAVRQMCATRARPALTVSVDPALASTWLVQRLARFDAVHPADEVRLEASARPVDLSAGEADVAVRYGTGSYPSLCAWRLFDDRVFPVCSPALRDREPPLREPSDLAGHALIHLDWQPARGRWPGWREWVDAAQAAGVDSGRGIRFTDHALALQAASAGLGVALASEPLARAGSGAARAAVPPDAGDRIRLRRARASR